MRKRLIFTLLIIFLLGLTAYFYINNFFLPVKFKNFVESKASLFLERNVSIEEIRFELIEGFLLKDITIYEENSETKKFLTIPKISFNILLAPIFKSKNIIIPHIKVLKPHAHLIRDTSSAWNFEQLFNKQKIKKEKQKYNLLVRKLSIEEGRTDILDYAVSPKFLESVNSIHLICVISIEKKIHVELNAGLTDEPTKLHIDGEYDLESRLFESTIQFNNLPFLAYKTYLPQLAGFQKGLLSYGDLRLTLDGKVIYLTGHTSLENTFWENNGRSVAGNFNLTNMKLRYENSILNLQGDVTAPDMAVRFGKNLGLKAAMSGTIKNLTAQQSRVGFIGKLHLEKSLVTLPAQQSLQADILLPDLHVTHSNGNVEIFGPLTLNQAEIKLTRGQYAKGSFTTKQTSVVFDSNQLSLATDFQAKDLQLKIAGQSVEMAALNSDKITLQQSSEKLTVGGRVTTDQTRALINQTYSLTGSPSVDFDLNQTNGETGTNFTYAGKTSFINARLTGLPKIDSAESIKGDIHFTHNKLSTEQLTLQIEQIPLTLKGNFTNFDKLDADLTMNADQIDLRQAQSLLMKYYKDLGLTLSGSAALMQRYTGSLKNFDIKNLETTLTIDVADIETEKLPKPVNKLSGRISLGNDALTWENLTGTYDGKTYALQGELKDLSRPKVSTTIHARGLRLAMDGNILNRALQIKSLTGQYLETQMNINGDMHFPAGEELRFDLRGEMTTPLENLGLLIPQLEEKLKPHNLKGKLTVQGLFRGTPKDWRNWELALKGYSPQLSTHGYTFSPVDITFNQRDRNVSRFDISASIYGGTIEHKSSIDLTGQRLPMTIDLLAENINLGKWRKDKKITEKNFDGQLFLSGKFQLPLAQPKEINGSGTLQIKEGYLWHLIPQFSDINFTGFDAVFTVENKRVNVNDSRLISRVMLLNGKGFVNFDKYYKFNITPQTIVASDSNEINALKILRQIVGIKCEGVFGQGKLGCSPEINILKTPANLIQGFGGILEGLL